MRKRIHFVHMEDYAEVAREQPKGPTLPRAALFFFVCRVAPHPHTPSQFRKRRLQDLVYL